MLEQSQLELCSCISSGARTIPLTAKAPLAPSIRTGLTADEYGRLAFVQIEVLHNTAGFLHPDPVFPSSRGAVSGKAQVETLPFFRKQPSTLPF